MSLGHVTSHSTITRIIVCIEWSIGWGSHYTNYWCFWVQTITTRHDCMWHVVTSACRQAQTITLSISVSVLNCVVFERKVEKYQIKITKKLTGLTIILKCFWASLRSCTEHDLTREKVDHLLSQLEGSDYLEQCEGMTGHSQWLLVQNTVPVPLTWMESKGKNHWKLWWSNVWNMLSNFFMRTSLHLKFICSSMCLFMFNTVKALISGHQWDVKKVSVTRADRLWGWFSKEVACIASVSVGFGRKERPRNSDHFLRGQNAENPVPLTFIASQPHGNACYTGYERGHLWELAQLTINKCILEIQKYRHIKWHFCFIAPCTLEPYDIMTITKQYYSVECKWIYDRSYIWTVEKNMKTWLKNAPVAEFMAELRFLPQILSFVFIPAAIMITGSWRSVCLIKYQPWRSLVLLLWGFFPYDCRVISVIIVTASIICILLVAPTPSRCTKSHQDQTGPVVITWGS